jgi:hypothetical protein
MFALNDFSMTDNDANMELIRGDSLIDDGDTESDYSFLDQSMHLAEKVPTIPITYLHKN